MNPFTDRYPELGRWCTGIALSTRHIAHSQGLDDIEATAISLDLNLQFLANPWFWIDACGDPATFAALGMRHRRRLAERKGSAR